ncbi:MAG: hypothetical protein PVH61_09060 [Candidatus Aminicenantes bacterium]
MIIIAIVATIENNIVIYRLIKLTFPDDLKAVSLLFVKESQ